MRVKGGWWMIDRYWMVSMRVETTTTVTARWGFEGDDDGNGTMRIMTLGCELFVSSRAPLFVRDDRNPAAESLKLQQSM